MAPRRALTAEEKEEKNRKLREKRAQEDPLVKEKRLKDNRDRAEFVREEKRRRLNPQEEKKGRDERAEQARRRRQRETKGEKENRQKLDAKRKRVARDEETEAENQVRLQDQAVRQEALREEENEQEHRARLEKQSSQQNALREKETNGDRMARVVADRLRHQNLNEDEVLSLVSSLKKVAIFWSCHNLGPWNLWDSLFNALREAKDLSQSEATKHCILACHSAILWEFLQLENGSGHGTSANQQKKQLRDRLDAYILLMKELVITSNVALVRDQAYVSVCDLLIAFSKNLKDNPFLRPVVYVPDLGLEQALNNFIQTYVFVPPIPSSSSSSKVIVEKDDEEHDESKKIEELQKRRDYLSGFCELVVYNVLPIHAAADVFRHYVKYYNDYGDIIKMTLGKALEINKISCARTMVLSLSLLFRDLTRHARSRINRQSKEFQSVKELAKNFAILFGLDSLNNREAVTALHRDAIQFATNPLENPNDPTGPPANLAFLEITSEFTYLLKQDQRMVLQLLDQCWQWKGLRRGGDWEPLFIYQNSISKLMMDLSLDH